MHPKQTTLTLNDLDETGAMKAADIVTEIYHNPPAVSVNETDEIAKKWNVIAYCLDSQQANSLRDFLMLHGYQAGDLTVGTLPDTDWVKRSLEGLPPITAGRFYVHGGHDRDRRRSSGISLEIDAGTAFGTGHHGTTIGCLAALDRLLKAKRPGKILDVGTGTGILAIAAAKALRLRVVATDIDREAVTVTRDNARINGVAPHIVTVCAPGLKAASIIAKAPYDLIFANILAKPLLYLAPHLCAVLAKRGTLILSGITADQLRMILPAYRNRGLTPFRITAIDSWVTLALRK